MLNEYEVGVLQEARGIINEYSIKGLGDIYSKLKGRVAKNQAIADKGKNKNYTLGYWRFKITDPERREGMSSNPVTTNMVKKTNALFKPSVRAQLKVNRDTDVMDKIKKHAKWKAEQQVKNQLSVFD